MDLGTFVFRCGGGGNDHIDYRVWHLIDSYPKKTCYMFPVWQWVSDFLNYDYIYMLGEKKRITSLSNIVQFQHKIIQQKEERGSW